MKQQIKRIIPFIIAAVMILEPFFAVPSAADPKSVSKGERVEGYFAAVPDMDIATVRYYKDPAKTDYGFAEVTFDTEAGNYRFSFPAPYDGFTAVQASSLAPEETANVVAQYYSLTKWDGAVDVSWYNEEDADFYLKDPAQLAGFAAVVNGSVDSGICAYQVKGSRSKPEDRSVNRGLPDVIESTYMEASLPAGVKDYARKGVMKHDFANRTVHLMKDMDMGGVPGEAIDHSRNRSQNSYAYPNWTPIGGEYLMDVSDSDSMIISFFNGTIDGHGHAVKNLYCYRWSYPSVGDTAYAYAQGTAFVGAMGSLYNDDRGKEEVPEKTPALRNFSLSGYVYGRRMVGGIAGCLGGGANAADGQSVSCGVRMENLANHAYAYCTDSKGLGGIVGMSMTKGAIVNCYNTGTMCANYAAPTGGIIGSNEQMDLLSCYNRGQINSNGNDRGRGIGSNNNGKNYLVDRCYFLAGTPDCREYPGYYTYNMAPSVSVTVTELSEEEMTNGTLLAGLNAAGCAFLEGEDGFPVLNWELASGSGTLSVLSTEGGSVQAEITGECENGAVVHLSNTPDDSYRFRYYTWNGTKITGDFVTVNGETNVSAFFESARPGVLNIEENKALAITVRKNGMVLAEDGTYDTVKNYPLRSGDPVYEGDLLIVEAQLKEGESPEDENLQYSATTDQVNAFRYDYTYTGGTPKSTIMKTFSVDASINEEGAALSLSVTPLTTPKKWSYVKNTAWYSEGGSEFTLRTPNELAGLIELVSEGITFAGKTIRLGNDISLKNNDGTKGKRIWDGIGENESTAYFAGIFDGQDHSITGMETEEGGLFRVLKGVSEASPAVIRNLNLYGVSSGTDAAGFAAKAACARIENCSAYVRIRDGSGCCGGIAGTAGKGSILSNCKSYGKIHAAGRIGGIAGNTEAGSLLKDCSNAGSLTFAGTNGTAIGGIAGSLSGEMERCSNTGAVYSCGKHAGGLCGQSVSKAALIRDSYNAGALFFEGGAGNFDCLGGLIGFGSFYNIENTFNVGILHANTPLPENHLGGIIGREGKSSYSKTKQAVYLDSTCSYADDGLTIAELPETEYAAGMHVFSAADFASENGVLAAVNENNAFELNGGAYPEHKQTGSPHVHEGGEANCSEYAVCTVCGLEYGSFDSEKHGETVLKNQRDAVWATDGYSGDLCCSRCHAVLQPGEILPANTEKEVLTVVYENKNEEELLTKKYTIAQLEAMRETEPIGYSYGSKSEEIVAANEYVTLETLLEDSGFGYGNLDSIVVLCDGSTNPISKETLASCNRYYDPDGKESAAPAALCFSYTTLAGSLKEVIPECKPNDNIRFGYGISEEQYRNKEAVGGARLVSPVRKLRVVLNEDLERDPETQLCLHRNTKDGSSAIRLIEAVAPTCTHSGNSEHYACSGCGQTFEDAEGLHPVAKKNVHLARLPHDLQETKAVAATCRSKGNIAYWTCTSCKALFRDKEGTDEIKAEETIIPEGAHVRALPKEENRIDPTCEAAGSYESVVYCANCGNEISRIRKRIAKLPKPETPEEPEQPEKEEPVKPVVIKRIKQKLKVTTYKKTVNVRKKSKKITALKVKGVKEKASIRFKKLSGTKKIRVNQKTGIITVLKGCKKGTYTLKIQVRTAQTKHYLKTIKNVKLKIKVK